MISVADDINIVDGQDAEDFFARFEDLPIVTPSTPVPEVDSHRVAPVLPLTGTKMARATAFGTCGEFVQGVLSSGEHFHVTCPIQKTATVSLQTQSAADFQIEGLDPSNDKLALAIKQAAIHMGIDPFRAHVDHWSDLHVGKGMGSSTADVVAGVRALASAYGQQLAADEIARIAVMVESSDGSMYSGIVAFCQRSGQLLRAYKWYPQMLIVMAIPPAVFNTESASFEGKGQFASEFEQMLSRLDRAVEEHDPIPFAQAATRSAEINQMFVPNPLFEIMLEHQQSVGAEGVIVGHTGTVAGLLYPIGASKDSEESRETLRLASHAARLLRHELSADTQIELTVTPQSPAHKEPEEIF